MRPRLSRGALGVLLALSGCGGRTIVNGDRLRGYDIDPLIRDGATRTCLGNGDCASTDYCDLDLVCTVGSGRCVTQPTACPESFAPVCGCDGQTYDNECSAHAKGISVLRAGSCEDCAALDKDYVAAVESAKACCYNCSLAQCTTKVQRSLDCPCDTYVEPSNNAAIQKLTSLAKQWVAAKCVASCPPTACRVPVKGAACGPKSVCMDLTY